jgi:hypothetical protein
MPIDALDKDGNHCPPSGPRSASTRSMMARGVL